MKYLVLLTILLSCSVCCPINKKKSTQRDTASTETRQTIQTDSILFHCLKQSDNKQNTRLKLLTFSPPDSNKQQHVQSILLLTSEAEETITENNTFNQVSIENETIETRTQQRESTDKSIKTGPPIFQLTVCLLAAFSIWILYHSKK